MTSSVTQSAVEPLPSTGHVFVVRGKIGHLVSDAAVVSTDGAFTIEPHWHAIIGAENDKQAREHRPAQWSERGWGPSAKAETTGVWFLDVTGSFGGHDQFARLHQLLTAVACAGLTSTVKGRPLPLVAVPVIGTAGGGLGHRRGEVVRRLLDTCHSYVAEHPIDVVIVASSAASYAALQEWRRTTARTYFPALELSAASRLGHRAHNGSLALFIGAGASVPAGAPSWKTLLAELVRKARLDPKIRRSFKKLAPLDQAELLHQELKDDELGEAVASILQTVNRPAIAHLLLSALGCASAVTTNYDQLYEIAVRQGGEAVFGVLPNELPSPGRRWILKMHGDVGMPKSIVLTRGQFVAFTSGSGPAGAVLQSLLLTKHVLIVGTSMTDDNLLRLIHEVGAFRRSHLAEDAPHEQFGTILDVGDDPARERLHRRHFDWRTMPGESLQLRSRELEIFLDAVAMYAAGDQSWLLDRAFDDLHTDDERSLAARLRELANDVRQSAVVGSAWEALWESLAAFGAAESESARRLNAVGRAERIATRAHRRQVDKIGVPYIQHVAMVASFVRRLPEFVELDRREQQDVLAAAWLHDVMEDTGETGETLRASGVSERTIRLVGAMTRRADISHDVYYAGLKNEPLARLVKVADIASNLVPERTRELPVEVRDHLAQKYEHALTVLGVDRAEIDALQSPVST